MKKIIFSLVLLCSISTFANDNSKCRDAITDATITASLLTEYKLKKPISPEMEEHVSQIVAKLTKQITSDIEAAVSVCGEK